MFKKIVFGKYNYEYVYSTNERKAINARSKRNITCRQRQNTYF